MPEPAKHASGWEDPIVVEVRATREALLADAGYDIHELCRRLRARQSESGHIVVNLRRRVQTGESERSRKTKTG